MDDQQFGFEKLIAFQRAREFGLVANGLLRGLPRGEAALADQLRRAGDSPEAERRLRLGVAPHASGPCSVPRDRRRRRCSRLCYTGVLLNIAEGAGRATGTEQARYYDIARGSANECAAVIAVCQIRALASAAAMRQARAVLLETVHLLTGLARAARTRAG